MASDHESEDDDLYGTEEVKTEQAAGAKDGDQDEESSGDEPMDEGADSGDDDDDDDDSEDSESVSRALYPGTMRQDHS